MKVDAVALCMDCFQKITGKSWVTLKDEHDQR